MHTPECNADRRISHSSMVDARAETRKLSASAVYGAHRSAVALYRFRRLRGHFMTQRIRCGALALGCALLANCSLISVKQDPFPAMEVRADRPPPGPARVVLTASSIEIKDKVQFEFGKSELLPVSFPLLNDVAAVLKDNPQIELLQVEGHTDAVGSAEANRKLSAARAEAVRNYLAKQGIKKARLVAKGFGPDKPIASNDDDAGREQNRRVEFNIVKQGPKKTVVQDD